MILYVLLFISIIVSALFCVSYLLVFNKYKKIQNDVSKISIAVKRLRYGDVHVRVDNLNNKEFENSTNRLFETIADREMMIKEYQSTLAKKNLTLEEIIKQEKQLQLFKEEFAATLTHDMKVPVIAELNSLEYLIEGRFGELNEKQLEVLKLMKSSNQELRDLIENMLETYRLDQKELKLNKSNHNLNEFLISVINEMSPIVYSSSHKIVFDIEKTKDVVFSFDDFQIKRVIKNLIQNAVTFSPNNSEITINSYKNDSNLCVEIKNIGNNISKEDLELIFQKYYSGSSKFKKAGTGLGLYLSQQIALAHDGYITVDNSEDGITSFKLSLPVKI